MNTLTLLVVNRKLPQLPLLSPQYHLLKSIPGIRFSVFVFKVWSREFNLDEECFSLKCSREFHLGEGVDKILSSLSAQLFHICTNS